MPRTLSAPMPTQTRTMRDPVVPPVNAEFLHERLPKSRLDFIDAGHFTWEDAADEYAMLVASWWGGGYATTGSARS